MWNLVFFGLIAGNSRATITNRTSKIEIQIKTITLNRNASPNTVRPKRFAGKLLIKNYRFDNRRSMADMNCHNLSTPYEKPFILIIVLLTCPLIHCRYTRDVSQKNSLPTSDRLDGNQTSSTDSNQSKNLFYGLNIDTDVEQTASGEYSSSNRTRTKRQSFGRSSLCEVNSQYIMPQAALNNRGICTDCRDFIMKNTNITILLYFRNFFFE